MWAILKKMVFSKVILDATGVRGRRWSPICPPIAFDSLKGNTTSNFQSNEHTPKFVRYFFDKNHV